MGKLRLVLGIFGGGTGLLGIGAVGAYVWATSTAEARLTQSFETHSVEIPVPFPLSDAEIEELRAEKAAELAAATAAAAAAAPPPKKGAKPAEAATPDPLEGVDLEQVAMERAVARGKHLVEARYACTICHGANFGGGTMIDDAMIGTLKGPNITTGKGSKVIEYTMNDWDRAVRHGVLPDGKPSAMPSDDFIYMSDRELSDVVAYIKTVPPVDSEVPKPTFGPLGTFLLANGGLPISAEKHHDHMAAHAVEPPPTGETVEFGKHLAQICTGCHRADLNGGPMSFGPPDWPPAGNLTSHEEGIAGWTFEQFDAAMRTGKRPDGTLLRMPMTEMMPYAQNMTETEMKALWVYAQSLTPLPDGV